jgi:hypothetical protein
VLQVNGLNGPQKPRGAQHTQDHADRARESVASPNEDDNQNQRETQQQQQQVHTRATSPETATWHVEPCMRLPFREPRGTSAGFASQIPLNRKYAAESMRDKVSRPCDPLQVEAPPEDEKPAT